MARVRMKNLVCLKLQPRGYVTVPRTRKKTQHKKSNNSGGLSYLPAAEGEELRGSLLAAPRGLVVPWGVGGMCKDGAGMIPHSPSSLLTAPCPTPGLGAGGLLASRPPRWHRRGSDLAPSASVTDQRAAPVAQPTVSQAGNGSGTPGLLQGWLGTCVPWFGVSQAPCPGRVRVGAARNGCRGYDPSGGVSPCSNLC